MQPLCLTAFSLVTALGSGIDATLDALRAGRSGLVRRCFDAGLTTFVGEVAMPERSPLAPELAAFDCRNNRLVALALQQDKFAEAVDAARQRYGAARIGIFLGTSTSGMEQTEQAYRRRDPWSGKLPADYHYAETHNTFALAALTARLLRLAGPAVVVSAACATTAKAFGNAARMIAAGLCDAAVVGGADSLCATTVYGFRSLGLTSEGPCRPFDAARDGLSLGEAAGFALLEKPEGRAGPNDILLLGLGESNDAHHMSTPDPQGSGARLAMERALASAGLAAPDIDYINLHGTATRVGDAAEDIAITATFGTQTPCSSTKSHTGHTLGAAGIVETIISSLAIRHDLMPGSPCTRSLDPSLRSRYLIENCAARIARVMSNSFGFGGSNCSLILGRAAP
ncbi:MAG TPA: beta-ketoacyl-[acyl-carrier-protein] synthase family protein [Stellaceae bacterium]|nr:beta-ketoacyl-[acyl-carrier-protein] synthase family protein [Stellaceae bacterium]